jgi:hypothetical protein
MSVWIPIAESPPLAYETRYEVTWLDGIVSVLYGKHIDKGNVIAVREYNPEPYLPPRAKRRTVVTGDGATLREALPGDPDPDRVLEVIKDMRSLNIHYWADKLEGKQ